LAALGAAIAGMTELHKFRLYLPQIPWGMANLHRTAGFVSQITALTRKPEQYPAQMRKLKMVQVVLLNSVLGVAERNF
jgi:hypothetical protein